MEGNAASAEIRGTTNVQDRTTRAAIMVEVSSDKRTLPDRWFA